MTYTATTRQTMIDTTAADSELSPRRLNVMRFGYAFLGVGLAIVKWPILIHLLFEVRTPGDAWR